MPHVVLIRAMWWQFSLFISMKRASDAFFLLLAGNKNIDRLELREKESESECVYVCVLGGRGFW